MSVSVDQGSPATKSRNTVVEALRARKRSEDTGREKGDGVSKSEDKAIQETKPAVAKTTIGMAGNSPGGLGLKSHNKVVEALRERKLSAREPGGEGGGDEGGRKTSQGDEEGIKKEQGLSVAQGLLFPPSEASLQEMDTDKVRHADNFRQKMIYQLEFFCDKDTFTLTYGLLLSTKATMALLW